MTAAGPKLVNQYVLSMVLILFYLLMVKENELKPVLVVP